MNELFVDNFAGGGGGLVMVTQYFKRADKGFCPTYHSPDGVMYWIQDHKIKHFNGGGEYEYDFMCRCRERIEKIGKMDFIKK